MSTMTMSFLCPCFFPETSHTADDDSQEALQDSPPPGNLLFDVGDVGDVLSSVVAASSVAASLYSGDESLLPPFLRQFRAPNVRKGGSEGFFGVPKFNPRYVPSEDPVDDDDDDDDDQGTYDEDGVYTDEAFPAAHESLGNMSGDDANPEEQEKLMQMLETVREGWARPKQMWGTQATIKYVKGAKSMPEESPVLFECTSPLDVKQGGLGDCWLVSAMAAIAEFPFLVRRLFKQTELAEDCRYDVRLYDMTEQRWDVVTIDDRLPFAKKPKYYGNIMMAKPTGDGEVWPCLLEKAAAKLVGSYGKLDGGFAGVALEMLTGKPTISIKMSPDGGTHECGRFFCRPADKSSPLVPATVHLRRIDSQDNPLKYYYCDDPVAEEYGVPSELNDSDELWERLHTFDQQGCLVVCSSRGSGEGVIGGHAYSVIQFVQVDDEVDDETGEPLRLVQIRNPHGRNEFHGRFSDGDGAWEDYPVAASECGMDDPDQHDKKDGAFWMSFADFMRLFKRVDVNMQTNCDTNGQVQARYDPENSSHDDVDESSLEVEGHTWDN